jgi:hypothetical protein
MFGVTIFLLPFTIEAIDSQRILKDAHISDPSKVIEPFSIWN